MSNDYLTMLFVAVDNFSYSAPIKKIDPEDMMDLNAISKKTAYISFGFLVSGLILSRNTKRLLNYLKRKFDINESQLFPSKETDLKYQRIDQQYTAESLQRQKENVLAERKELYNYSYKDINITPASKTYTRKKAYEVQQTRAKVDMQLPSEEIIGRMDPSNHAFNEKLEKNRFILSLNKNLIEGNLVSKFLKGFLIWLPVTLIIFISLYNYYYSKLGLYMKYQPLIDSYYLHLQKQQNKDKMK